MSKATKRIIATVTLIIVILLAGASIWWNIHSKEIYAEFETLITKELTEALGTNVKVGSLKINSPVTASLKDVAIYDHNDKVIVSVGEIVAYYQPLYLLFGNEPIDIITKVNLKSPQVYLVQDIDETWNIEDIKIKKSDQKTSFKTNVFFENGAFFLSMLQGKKEIHKITGRIDFSHWPIADAFLRFNLEPEQDKELDGHKMFSTTKRPMIKAVINMDDFSVLGSLSLPKIYPVDWQQFLPGDFPAEFKEGLIIDTEISLSYKDKKYLYKGSLTLDNLAVEIKDTEIINNIQTILNDKPPVFTKTNAKVTFSNEGLHILNGETKLLDQKFSINGEIDLKEAEPVLDLILNAENLETNSFFAEKGLKGKINLDAYFKGKTSNLDAKAYVSWNEIFYKDQSIKLGEIDLSYSNNTVFIEKGSFNFLNSKVVFLGNMNLENSRYSLDLSGADLDLSQLIGIEARGMANVELKSEGVLENLDLTYFSNLNFNVQASVVSGEYSGIPFENLYLLVNQQNGLAEVKKIAISLPNNGFIDANGIIQNNILNLDLIGSQIDLSSTSIKVAREKKVKGVASFTGKVLGSITDPYALLDLKVSNLIVNDGVLGELNGNVKITGEMATLNDVILKDSTGEYKIDGNITLNINPYFDIVLSTKNVRAENMLKVASVDYPLTGFMEQEARVNGTLDNIYLKGWVRISKGSYDGYLIDEAFGDYEYKDGIIYVDGFTVKWLDSNIFLNGAIYPDNTLKLEVNATEINLVKMPVKYPYPVTGWVNIVGNVTGSFDKPIVDGKMTASRIVANGQILTGLTGKFDYKNRKVNIEKLSVTQGHGYFELQGYYNVDSKILEGDLDLTAAPVQGIMKLLKISNDNFVGDIDGEIILEGTIDSPAISVVGKINNSAVDRYEFGTVDVNLYYKNKVFIIHKLNAESENGSLMAEGMANLDGDIDIQISGKNLDSGLFSSLINTTFDPKGRIDFSAIAQGKTRNPELTAAINVESSDKEESGFDTLSTVFTMKNAVLNIDKFQVDKGEYRLSIQGIVPLKALSKSSFSELGAHEQMNVKINLDNADLQILPLIFDEVDWATGKTYGTIDITGTLAKPLVNGSISVPQGSLKLADLSDPITDIEVAILFEGEKINIEKINGQMNKGSFVIAGNAFIKGIDVPYYDLILTANKLKIDNKYFDGQIDSTLKVTNEGLNGRPLLKGNIDISNTTVDIPEFPESDSGVMDFDIDVDINIGKKVRLYNSSLYDLPVEGSLKLRGTLQNPYLAGRLESKRGSITYLTTRFNVTEASADFSSVQKLIPNINLSAKTRVGGALINLNVKGPADDLIMHLSSEPHLSNEAIMRALTFGIDPVSVGSGAYQDSQNDQLMTLLAMGMQIQAVSKLEGFFRERADIDVFRIEPLSMFDYRSRRSKTEKYDSYYNYNLKIGKYITDDILIMYNAGLVESNSSITVQYDVTPKISISGTFGGLNNGLYTIETRFRF